MYEAVKRDMSLWTGHLPCFGIVRHAPHYLNDGYSVRLGEGYCGRWVPIPLRSEDNALNTVLHCFLTYGCGIPI